ncbi:NAD(P)-dependent oxidoreductase [Micromonospora sp. KC606]|uniref:NAD-dependent epimerase/dehydratase family protein n=1 Tax=Micromonospora sp. KC606 TaxID=2530379 RepID=UPI00140486A8|nr:NAD(P)-dependent oxidoreductase [Micromonospora sp. KC606]
MLLTGATGYLGRWVAEGFAALGDDVTTFSGRQLAEPSVETARVLREATAKADVVCHLAAATPLQPGPPNGAAYAQGIVDATHLLLDAAAATSRCHVVFASTAMITGLNGARTRSESERVAYAESKLVAEQLVERYSAQASPAISLRLNTLSGPRIQPDRGVVAAALRAAHESRPFPVYGRGSSGRDYLHVLDAARAVISAARRPTARYQAIEIGSGQLATIEAIVAAVERVTRRRVLRRYLPDRADVDERPACDLRPAREALGWTPTRSQLATIVSDQWAEQQAPGTFAARLVWDLDASGRPLTIIPPHGDQGSA